MKKVEPETLERVFEAARLAPSAKNRQTWRFVAIQDEEKRKEFEEAAFGEEHIGQAPVIVACCSTNTEYKMPNGQLSYPIDISFAVSNMLLQATHEGLGSCVVTTFNEEQVQEILTIPFSMRVVFLLLLGYPVPGSDPPLRERFPLERIRSYDHW